MDSTTLPLPPDPAIVDEVVGKKKGIWQRRKSRKVNPAREKVFDVLFGVIAPILLLIFDPVVFRDSGTCWLNAPILGRYAIFAYLAIGLGVLILSAWLSVRMWGNAAFAAGALLPGTLVAAGLGIVLLPASMLGLLMLVGLLGLIPFLTARIYYRHGMRAFHAAMVTPDWKRIVAGLLAGVVLVIGVPTVAQWQVNTVIESSMAKIMENPAAPDPTSVAALTQLNSLCLRLCTSNIEVAFDRAISVQGESQETLRGIFNRITGNMLTVCNTSD